MADANNKLTASARSIKAKRDVSSSLPALQRKISYHLITQERLGRADTLQAIHQGGETTTLSGVLFSQFSGISQLDALREIGFQMKPVDGC